MGHYIETEQNVKLFVEDIGSGTPLIFMHGWPLNHKMFEYQFTLLSRRGYRCIGIDQRGFGRSDAPSQGYSYDRMADDLRAVIDHLELQDAVMIGFSVGGAISIRYMARHHGHRVSKLALVGAAAPVFTQRHDYAYGMTNEEMNDQIHAVMTDRPKMLKDFGKLFLAHKANLFNAVSNDFTDWLHRLGLEASAWGTIRVAESLRDEDLRPDLAQLRGPVTIFQGLQDKICPPDFGQLLVKNIPESTLVHFEHSGHGIMFDEPQKFNDELISFLEKSQPVQAAAKLPTILL
ncbi:alpha/beta fold hydrolase [Paenibacillus sp. GCM10012307]|uniref:Alpha/beta hydrolase n=1 Tax=Paenibacillus roseus TaxID=2798579 RepID=A0A934J4H8_9BACL|nr:alpha/beta hydrolase [Paenibacillus roseus]MBJ6361519.1 alpha/beta hydrolase [Paenibacillus roseus]